MQPRSDRYAIRRRLGGGPLGEVYEAWDRERKAPVALKVLDAAPGGDAVYRLKQGFRALADLSHPNLVRLYELVGDDDVWFIVMELVQGTDFTTWVRGEPGPDTFDSHAASEPTADAMATLPPEQLAPASLVEDPTRLREALIQAVRGVAALHAAGKLHRDLKPSNVLVTPEGRVVLVDFGLIYDIDRAVSELSRVDQVVGTAAFMPPEQARGEQPSEASDLYSLGVMLFQGLTGRLPFEGPLVRVLLRKQSEEAPRPSDLVEGVPSDLDDLCAELLARDPVRRPSAADVLARLGDPDQTPSRAPTSRLEGRETERQELEEAWAAARAGRTSLVLLRGRSGIGKSSLVDHFLRGVRRHEDVLVLRGRCWERESVPFEAFDHLVDGVRRRLGRLDDAARAAVLPEELPALARLFPVLARFVPEERLRDVPADPADLRQRAFAAFRALLRRLTTLRPVVVFLDDTQWADDDSARLLSSLLRELRDARLLIVVAWRSEDEDTSPFLVPFLQDPVLLRLEPRRIDLTELSKPVATAVARSLLGDDLPDPSQAAVRVAEESGGNPFLLAELAGALGDGDATTDLDELFRARIDALAPEPRRLMDVVALAGRPLPLRIVAAAADVEQEPLHIVGVLRSQRLVRTTRGAAGDMVEPFHARIAQAGAAAIPPEDRPGRHLALARAMQQAGWADPEALMEHYRAAGDTDRAGLLAMEAARGAADALAFARAADLFEQALELREWPTDEYAQVATERADALTYAGRGEEAARAYLQLAEEADPGTALQLRRKAGGQLLFAGRIREGLQRMHEIAEAVGLPLASSPGWTLLRTWWRRLWTTRRSLDFEPVPAAQLDERALQRIDTCWHVALGLGMVDPVQASWYHVTHLRLALDAREPYRVARGLAMEIAQGFVWGQSSPERRAYLVRRGRELATQSGRAHATGLIALGEGIVAYLQGRWDASRRALQRAERTFTEQCTRVAFELAVSRLYRMKAALWAGRWSDAYDLHRRLIADADESGNRFLADGLHSDLCVLLPLARGRVDEARAALDAVVGRWSRPAWDEWRLLALFGQVELALWEGRTAEAHALLERHRADWRSAGLHRLASNRRRLHSVQGRVALTLAAATQQARHLRAVRRSVRLLLRDDTPPAAPLARLLQAGASALAGDRAAATDQLGLALQGFEQAQMDLHYTIARHRLVPYLAGDEAAREASLARRWFGTQGITEPERLVASLAPGFDG